VVGNCCQFIARPLPLHQLDWGKIGEIETHDRGRIAICCYRPESRTTMTLHFCRKVKFLEALNNLLASLSEITMSQLAGPLTRAALTVKGFFVTLLFV